MARAYELSPGGPRGLRRSLRHGGSSELVHAATTRRRSGGASSRSRPSTTLLFTYITLTAAYANLDRMDEARAHLRKVREISPHLTIKLIIDGAAKEDSFAWAVIPGLRKTGLPER